MSTIAGVCRFDNAPMEHDRAALCAALQPADTDGVITYVDAGIAMAHAADGTWTNAGSLATNALSGAVLTWDGRLDNGDDLRLRLGHGALRSADDGAIALAAFERWRDDGLASLIGDWCAAIWEPASRTLHLVRDVMGVRPLYVAANRTQVCWSSSLGELARRTGREDAIDVRFVARFMAQRPSTDITPYAGIVEVPTGCCVSFSAPDRAVARRYWQLEPGDIRYRDDRQYEAHFRSLWRDAVRGRLRTRGVIWTELSGGLDSSSVTCMASALIEEGSADAQGLQSIAHVSLDSPGGDERRFIAEVDGRCGLHTDIIGVEQSHGARDGETAWITPFSARGVQLACIEHVRQRGGRVLLSGRMGDAVMGASPDNSASVFDDFASGRAGRALANMRRWSRASRKPFIEIAAGLFGECLRAGTPSGPASASPAHVELLAEHLRPLAGERPAIPELRPRVRLAQRRLASLILGYAIDARLALPHELGDVTYAFPFAHRPLIEFLLAIPAEQLSAPGQTRRLMRRALDGLVPQKVLQRTSKGYYPPAMARLARADAAALLPVDRLEVVRRGWIDAARLAAAVRTLRDGGGQTSAEVRRVLRLEEWLVARQRRGPVGIPQRKEVTRNGVLIA